MVESLIWFLLAACSICIIEIQSEPWNEEPELKDVPDGQLRSVFGFRPCMDESCSDSSTPRPKYPVDEQSDEGWEPQNPDDEASIDYQVEYCLSVHESTVKEASVISAWHPDVKDIKLIVIEDLVRYTSQFSQLKVENCDPAMKLIEFIILAAQSLKHDYERHASACDFGKANEVGKSGNYPGDDGKSGYPGEEHGQTEVSTHGSRDLSSSEPSYGSTEASSQNSYPVSTEESSSVYPKIPVPKESCPEKPTEEPNCVEEIIVEEDHDSVYAPFVGSVRGIPGVHYPNYTDVPITSFSCADKKYVPGFYADLETGCQVFHVCYEHRRESFLCPIGTIFNQPILACDYWYSSNCSLAKSYYEVNAKTEETVKEESIDTVVEELVNVLVESKEAEEAGHDDKSQKVDITQFLPVKAKVVEFSKPAISDQGAATEAPEQEEVKEVASQIFHKMVSTATHVVSKTREVVEKIPEPSEAKIELKPEIESPVKAETGGKFSVPKAAKPIVKAKKLAAIKTALPFKVKAVVPAAKIAVKSVPVFAKAKLAASIPAAKIAAVKTAVPIAAKIAVKTAIPVAAAAAKVAAVKTTVPIAAMKTAVPIATKAKLALAVPAKVAVKTSIPVAAAAAKVSVLKTAVPVAKGKVAVAVPAAKIAAVKTAVPIAAKAKVAVAVPAKIAAVPVAAKAKVASTFPVMAKAKLAAIPKTAVKASVPFKAKMIASALPLAKAKIAAPAIKGALKTAGIPLAKAKMLTLPVVKTSLAGSAPVVKAKLAKAAAISPLTKKALALGYMKLLKAKKLALMG